MLLELNRDVETDNNTTGELLHDSKHFCYTLEDKVREVYSNGQWVWRPWYKIKGKTAIPSGENEVNIDSSNRYKREMPHLINVPDFTGIRIHPGNTDEDTEGCILPGVGRGTDYVSYSRTAYQKLFNLIEDTIAHGVKVMIKITNTSPLEGLHT